MSERKNTTPEPADTGIPLVRYEGGASDVAQINEAIETAWSHILKDAVVRRQIADAIGVEPDELPETSPFKVESRKAGLTGVEIAVLGFVGAVAYDAAKGLAADAVKEGLKAAWRLYMKDRAEHTLPTGAIGPELKTPDDVQ